MDRKKPTRTRKRKPRAIANKLYAKSADQVLKELTALLSSLGISAKFKLTQITTNTVSNKARGYKSSYASVIGEVLSYWHREPLYLDKYGNPKALRRTGRGASFQSLVSIALPRASAKQVLETLEATQSVHVDSNGLVTPLRRTIPVFSDKDLAILHTFIALRGFVRTLRHNLDSRPLSADQLFHRIAWNGDFNKNEIGRLKIWVNKHGQSFLESIDDWMKTHSIRRRNTTKSALAAVKASIGIYLSVEPD
jgi:Family of unknown function (DUF6502)